MAENNYKIDDGLICEFKRRKYFMYANSTELHNEDYPANSMLKCSGIYSYFHTNRSHGPFWSVTFSYPVIVYSYIVLNYDTTQNVYNTLYNWDLYQLSLNDTWIISDSQQNYTTISNKKKFIIQNPIKAKTLKIVGGKARDSYDDPAGDFLKFNKIEFYGTIIHEITCQAKSFSCSICTIIFIMCNI